MTDIPAPFVVFKPLAAINKRFTNIDENRVDVFRSIPSWGIEKKR